MKVCKKHGELTPDQIHPKGKSKDGKQYYGCKLCKALTAKKYEANNKEKIKKERAEYHQKRKLDPEFKIKKKKWMHDYDKRKRLLRPEETKEKERIWKNKWNSNNRDKINEEWRKAITELKDYYVKAHVKRNYGFENPPQDLVEAVKILIKIKRKIKENKEDA